MTDRRALAVSVLLTFLVFAVDVSVPLIDGAGALYTIPLLIASYNASPTLAVFNGWAASLLIVGRMLAFPASSLTAPVIVNRTVALAIIWVTVLIVIRLRRTATELAASARDLADTKYAIDQSAIVATTNVRGTITYVNDKFCEISKYSREELIGQDHRILNSGHHPKEFMRQLWTTIAQGRVWRGEIRNRAKDGSYYWVDTTIVPFIGQRGRPYQYMAIRYEITDRKRSEALLREQGALARLGEMAAVVAHEVKNPIAGIRGALQVIMGRMPPEQRDRKVMTDIIARLDALNGIVQDLLLYARPRQPKLEVVNCRSLLDSTADMLRRDPAFAGVTLRVMGDESPVSGDPEQLRLVLQNLLLNAAQAMKGQGAIDVAFTGRPEGCGIRIRDHGPGMPPEVRDKAFEPFFTTKHRGTGLGLAIARRVIEAHGGHIGLESADPGTIVDIKLPASPAARA